jgi:hypothetical protein
MYGVVPPVAANVPGYAVPTMPLGNEVVVTVGLEAPAEIVMLTACVAVLVGDAESTTVTEVGNVPARVGVPPIMIDAAMVDPCTVTPEGKLLTVQL